jgi:hypothetical protein
MSERLFTDAQHEAAHVVVGVALGLRLIRVSLGEEKVGRHTYIGTTEWHPRPWPAEAQRIMSAAGVAWERRGGDLAHAAGDLAMLRRERVVGSRLVAVERAAWAVLETRMGLHTRVARALLEHDLTGRDVSRMARGEYSLRP